jgi:putative CocE/NonD family hydrolase
MSDGIELNATLYRPHDLSAVAPAIFTLTPYVAQKYHEEGIYFAARGYAFLSVDVRGRGNSAGAFQPLIAEGEDGYEIVQWLVDRPYCNGKVAMWGGSYMGHVQWTTAAKRPHQLSTIVPVASPHAGTDFPMCNNIAAPYLKQWITLVSGRTAQDALFSNLENFWGIQFQRWLEQGASFRELDTFIGNPSPIFQEWIRHPEPGSYWDRFNPTAAQYAAISIPILTITGLYDGDQLGALKHYREHLASSDGKHRGMHFLVIGPWEHGGMRVPKGECGGVKTGPESLLDFRQLHSEWYAWTMKGGAKPAFLQKNVAYYVMGADQWRYADTLDAVTSHHEPLFLKSNRNPTDVFACGELTAISSLHSDPARYIYDPSDTRLAALESSVDIESIADQRLIFARIGQHLIYHSAPFEVEREVSGFFKLTLWISIDRPDTDFRTSVYEIGLNGNSVLLSSDTLRARYRKGLTCASLIQTREPLQYDFVNFTFTSHLIKARSRLRLVIGPINSIYSQKNYNSGGTVSNESMRDGVPVIVTVFQDEEHASVLHVPYGALSA